MKNSLVKIFISLFLNNKVILKINPNTQNQIFTIKFIFIKVSARKDKSPYFLTISDKPTKYQDKSDSILVKSKRKISAEERPIGNILDHKVFF